MPTPRELLNQAKQAVTEVDTAEAESRLGEAALLGRA